MNRWKVAFFSLLLLSTVAIALLGYGFVDMVYTTSQMRENFDRNEKSLEKLSDIFPKQAHSKKDIQHLLRSRNKYEQIVETDCSIEVDGLRFNFDGNKSLVSIGVNADTDSTGACAAR